MRGQRVALGLYAAEVAPGATCVVSHHVKDPCELRELWINHPAYWRVESLKFEQRWLELSKPIPVDEDGERLEGVLRWSINAPVDQRRAMANFGLYLTVTNISAEPRTIQAIVWAALL